MFVVCLCAHFQDALKESHLTTVKHIFRYLIGTAKLGLGYLKNLLSCDLIDYSDADFACCKIDRKSTL